MPDLSRSGSLLAVSAFAAVHAIPYAVFAVRLSMQGVAEAAVGTVRDFASLGRTESPEIVVLALISAATCFLPTLLGWGAALAARSPGHGLGAVETAIGAAFSASLVGHAGVFFVLHALAAGC